MDITSIRKKSDWLVLRLRDISPALALVVLACLAYIIILSIMNILQYRSFSSWWAMDIAQRNQTMYNFIYGRDPFFQTVYSNEHLSFFSQHLDLIMLLLLPIYALYPKVELLLVLQTIFLGLSALIVYKISNLILKSSMGSLIFSLIYLSLPLLHRITLSDLRFESYAIFFLLLMIYFFILQKKILFLISMILTLFCNETNAPVIAAFGIYSFFKRRGVVWTLAPLLIGTVWFFGSAWISASLLKSSQTQWKEYGPLYNYRHLGSTFGQIFSMVVKNPLAVIKLMFEPLKVEFLLKTFRPLLYVPILSPFLLIPMIPTFARNLLLNLATRDFREPVLTYYFASIVPFLIWAAIKFVKKVPRWQTFISLILLGSTLYFGRLDSPLIFSIRHGFDPVRYSISPRDRVAWFMIENIPSDKAVSTNHKFSAALSSRKKLWLFYSDKDPATLNFADYIFVDTLNPVRDFAEVSDLRERKENPEPVANLLFNDRWELLDRRLGLFLFKKKDI